MRKWGGQAHVVKGGAIFNLSSAAAPIAGPNRYVDYAAANAGIDVMTKGLALEVIDKGIRVNAVRPRILDTEIQASRGGPDNVARLRDTLSMKRGGTPAEVARAAMWLLSTRLHAPPPQFSMSPAADEC